MLHKPVFTIVVTLFCLLATLVIGVTAAPPAQSMTPCIDGFADIYPCENVDLMAFMSFADLGAEEQRGSDIWGWTDPETGDEYALMTMTGSTSFVRITDPENPVLVGTLATHTIVSPWRDAKVYNNHAFIVSEAPAHGMQVFDLTQLRGITTTQTLTETAHYNGFGSAHNVVINEESGYAYAVGAAIPGSGNARTEPICGAGLHVINISDPLNAQDEGCFATDGYTHDAQCVIYQGPDTMYTGREICFNSNEDTLTIVDMTDKAAPVQLSRVGYPNAKYTHQGWLTADQHYFLMNDELDEVETGVNTETYVWDVSDLDAPVLATIYMADTPSTDHNLYTRYDSAFLSNYTAGLRILDISEPINPFEVGYFDLFPEHNLTSTGYGGSWSNYPYFESGTVIASSVDRGLFILRPHSFALDAKPSLVVNCDGVENVSIDAHAIFDSDETIALSIQELASGVTASLSADTVQPGETVTLSIDASTLGENIPVNVVGTTANDSAETTINLIQTVPRVTPLITPLNVENVEARTITFNWESDVGVTSYQLQISDTPDFSNLIYAESETGTTHTVTDLPENSVLYWRVSAENGCGTSISSTQSVIARPSVSVCEMLYTESFEDNDGGWKSFFLAPEGITESINDWSWGSIGAYTGDGGWSVADTPGTVQMLSSPRIALYGDVITLRFWQKRDMPLFVLEETGAIVADDIVHLGANGSLGLFQSISDPMDQLSPIWSLGEIPVAGWSGIQAWSETTVDLTDLDGLDISFDFVSLMGVVSSTDPVIWAMDDVEIESCVFEPETADFGDLNESYGIAWHGGDGEQRIGAIWDEDGSAALDQDDGTDDINLDEFIPDEPNDLNVDVAQDGWLKAWFDWDGDGVFVEDELVVDQAVFAAISNTVSITPPISADQTTVPYRMRVTTDTVEAAANSITPTGFLPTGEVEDGTVFVARQSITLWMPVVFTKE